MRIIYRNLFEYILIIILLFGITVVFTYPLVTVISTKIPGIGGDAFTNSWFFWWIKYAVINLKQNPLFTNYQFFPYTINITGELSLFYSVLLLPINIVWGYIAAYNLRIFLSFIITGITMYLLMNKLFNEKFTSFSCAVFFTFSNARLSQMLVGHVDVISSEWLGIYLIFLYSSIKNKTITKKLILSGILSLSLQAYTDYRNFCFLFHYSFFSAFVSLFLSSLYKQLDYAMRLFKRLFIVWFFAFILVIPLIIMNKEKISSGNLTLQIENEWNATPSLLAGLPESSLVIGLINRREELVSINENQSVYLGLTLIILASIGIILRYQSKQWGYMDSMLAVLFILYILFMIGIWQILYIHLSVFPLFAVVRVPARLVIFAQLSLVIFSGYTLLALTKNKKTFWKLCIIGIVVIAVIFDNSIYPIVFLEKQRSNTFQLIQPDNQNSVLEIPFEFGDINHKIGGRNRRTFMSQTLYERPVIGGFLTWVKEPMWQLLAADQLIYKLARCQEDQICEELTVNDKQRFAKFYRIEYIVIRDLIENTAMNQYLQQQFHLVRIYHDTEVEIYKLHDYESY